MRRVRVLALLLGCLGCMPGATQGGPAAPAVAPPAWAPLFDDDGDDQAFTLAVLPDTQFYARDNPAHALAQTEWIAAHALTYRVAMVLHEGDLTDGNVRAQWDVMDAAFEVLDGVVPYAVVPGNHDLGPGGDASARSSLLDAYFPATRTGASALVEQFESGSMHNTLHRFSAGGQEWLVLALEFGPRRDVVEWAARSCEAHADFPVILLTHSYLWDDDTPAGERDAFSAHHYGVASLPGGAMDGDELHATLVQPHPNIRMVLSGHHVCDGAGRMLEVRANGSPVLALLANYQHEPGGGSGWLRLVRVSHGGTRVQVRTYSPVLGEERVEEDQRFDVDLGAGLVVPRAPRGEPVRVDDGTLRTCGRLSRGG